MGRTGLSRKELNRVEVMGRVKARSLRLYEAAEMLELHELQPGDISIVENSGTFLSWYDTAPPAPLTMFLSDANFACL